MKVNDPNLAGGSAGQIGGTGLDRARQTELHRRDGAARDSSAKDSPDRVALSQMSARLRTLSAESPKRVALLERLSAEVATGRYRPDANAVSRSLVEETLRED